MAKTVVIKQISLSLLDSAPYNPSSRSVKNLGKLSKSLVEHGQICPIIVMMTGKRYRVIDGHRRAAVARKNEWPTIMALVVEVKDKEQLYADLNATGKKLGGNDLLSVWLMEPKAVTKRMNDILTDMQDVLGRKRCEKIRDAGMSHNLFYRAMLIGNYMKLDDSDIPKFVDYLMEYSVQRTMHQAMSDEVNPSQLRKAFEDNREYSRRV